MISYSFALVAMISSVVHAAHPCAESLSDVGGISRDGMSCTPTEKSVGRRRSGSVPARSASESRAEMLERMERM